MRLNNKNNYKTVKIDEITDCPFKLVASNLKNLLCTNLSALIKVQLLIIRKNIEIRSQTADEILLTKTQRSVNRSHKNIARRLRKQIEVNSSFDLKQQLN